MTTTDREKIIDKVKEEYEPKILDLLKSVAGICKEAGLVILGDPYEMFDENYRWYIGVSRGDKKDDNSNVIDISLEIAEAATYGDDPEDGINFGLSIVEWGGRILGGLTPYNYTPECWVSASDEEAVSDRWQIMEDADLHSIPALIANKEDKR